MTPDEKVALNLIHYVEGTPGATHRDVAELAREIGEPDPDAVERALRLLEEVCIDDVAVIAVVRGAEVIHVATRPPLSLGTRLDEIRAELSDVAWLRAPFTPEEETAVNLAIAEAEGEPKAEGGPTAEPEYDDPRDEGLALALQAFDAYVGADMLAREPKLRVLRALLAGDDDIDAKPTVEPSREEPAAIAALRAWDRLPNDTIYTTCIPIEARALDAIPEVLRLYDEAVAALAVRPLSRHKWAQRDGLPVCSRCGVVRNRDRVSECRGALPSVDMRDPRVGDKPSIYYTIHLQARSRIGGGVVGELSHPRSYSGIGAKIPARVDRASSPEMRAMFEKWIEHGLSEYAENADGEDIPRLTPATSQDFLPRVAMYLITQAACEVSIRAEEGER